MASESKIPTRQRGHRTRARLVRAAEQVFAERGFLSARVADITAAAGVAHGSFYSYFDSKEEVFRELAGDLLDEVRAALDAAAEKEEPAERIRALRHCYVDLYERHAAMFGAIEQVGALSEFRQLRRDLRTSLVGCLERGIEASGAAGDPARERLDAHVTASALAATVDEVAHAWFVLGEPFDRAATLATLDTIWLRTLAIPDDAPALVRRRGARRSPARRATARS